MSENEMLPYKAINVFINQDYLENVLERVVKEKDNLPKEDQIGFINFFKQHVNVLGFRNPLRAPLKLQVNAYVNAFVEKEEVIPFTLSIWTKINRPFAEKVMAWLEKEGWKDLTLGRDYEEIRGFSNKWQEKVTFEKIIKKYKRDHPDASFSEDDLILMVLWISGQLPPEQYEL